MVNKFFLIIAVLILNVMAEPTGFLYQQKKHPRFRQAHADKYDTVCEYFKKKKISFPPKEIFIRILKENELVELWARSAVTDTFTFIRSYPFSAVSGTLGPKRKQGDMQVPEGFYHIDRFNSYSSFHLSLGINYPNASDRILSDKNRPGGDIFIHGASVTIGCVPITDDLIKELYLIAVYAKNGGQERIPVHIFPTYLRGDALERLEEIYGPEHMPFWRDLQEGFLYFERHHRPPWVSVEAGSGEYSFK